MNNHNALGLIKGSLAVEAEVILKGPFGAIETYFRGAQSQNGGEWKKGFLNARGQVILGIIFEW